MTILATTVVFCAAAMSSLKAEEPPEGAVVLFDGKDLSSWTSEKGGPPKWKLADGAMEVVPGAGSIMTEKAYKDFKLHLEFKLPKPQEGGGGDGNSGVYLLRRYEIQILNSFGKKPGKSDCGAIYNFKAPDESAAKPAGEWQSYEITFTAPKWEGWEKTESARITVVHNGKVIHDDVVVPNKTGAGQPEAPSANRILLQDHGSKVQFRNLWILER